MRKPHGTKWDSPDNFTTTDAGCLVWRWWKVNGYGRVWHDGKEQMVHRLALEKKLGIPLSDGEYALHSCDVPACCNPDHLRSGTLEDNMRDCASRGRTIGQSHPERMARGERQALAVLTEEMVRTIRMEYASGSISHRQLAEKYGVDASTVGRAIVKKTWAHVA